MRILINTPRLCLLGGVANHYMGLKKYWTEEVRYNTIGKRSRKNGTGKYWLPWDILQFIIQLLIFRPDVVLLNPSLGENALKRDFIFQTIAQRLGFKTVIFIHGFNLEYAESVNKDWISKHLNQASLIFVLAKQFKDILQQWGVTTPIELSTTKVDDQLTYNFPISSRDGHVKNILFLSRIEKTKGIYIAIKAFVALKEQYPDLSLTIVGGGGELNEIKEYVKAQQIAGTVITGPLSGDKLRQAFLDAHIYIFPSSHGEGMPTSVLEAMAFGLPIITRRVGGLVDFFEGGVMGYITDSLDPKEFASAIEKYILEPELTKRTAQYNYDFAHKHFMASQVALQLEQAIKNIL